MTAITALLTTPRHPDHSTSTKGSIISDIRAEGASADTPFRNGPTVDVLAPTDQERWYELAGLMHVEGGWFDLSGIKEFAGIGSRDTHITLDQLKALHRRLSHIVEGLDRPASEGSSMSHMVGLTAGSVVDLAAAAGVGVGVDGDALQRHVDGEGPLSQIAFWRVFDKMTGTKEATA